MVYLNEIKILLLNYEYFCIYREFKCTKIYRYNTKKFTRCAK